MTNHLMALWAFLLGATLTVSASEPFSTSEWNAPTVENRPLQIVHGQSLSEEKCVYFRDQCGLGGVVVSVPSQNGYVQNEENWKATVANIIAARAAGLRVWFYDELAWPSLAAGGAVLARDPTLESLELAWDKDAAEPFTVRKSYEYTFASMDTLRQALRHPNPLDPKATETFLDTTHRKLRDELGADLYHQVEAFFTDEPTLLGFSLLRIITPEERENHRIADPLDWSKPILPTVVWREGLDTDYEKKYGIALDKNALFGGETDEAKQTRRNFWSMIGKLNADSYFGTIRRYCESDPQGPLASGHTLCEESLTLAVPIDGNKLEVLKEFQIPGQDLLNSEPSVQIQWHWMTNALPVSAAYFTGQRRVMTEISEHMQRNSANPRYVSLDEMRAAAGVMASWGVTEFTLYYPINVEEKSSCRSEKTHKAYGDFVGRLNAVLREAEPVRPLLIYYPIEICQEEYVPVTGTLDTGKLSEKMRETAEAFRQAGAALSKTQISFLVVDAQTLGELADNEAGAKNPNSRTVRKLSDFSGLILSKNAQLDGNIAKRLGTFPIERIEGENVTEAIKKLTGPRLTLEPESTSIASGCFQRDGRFIFSLVNTLNEPWSGTVSLVNAESLANVKTWTRLNPATGEITPMKIVDTGASITLAPYETILLMMEN
ncbi:MAG: hypothetical protein Q4G68_07140 [Planctomycetia bacterium]|nr:hypothetical protein [Planctomycetia bacterium]